MATILCVLYPDPVTGYPPVYARDAIPTITRYANGETAPTPEGPLGFKPGELVGCVSGGLGLQSYLAAHGHEFIVTSDKDGPDSEFERLLQGQYGLCLQGHGTEECGRQPERP